MCLYLFIFPPGGAVDPRSAGGEHRLCGGALPQVPFSSGGAAQLPEDRTEPGHQERGMDRRLKTSLSSGLRHMKPKSSLCSSV